MRQLICARYARVGLSSSVYDVTPMCWKIAYQWLVKKRRLGSFDLRARHRDDNTDACISPLAASFNGMVLCPALIHYRVSAVTTVLVVGIDSSRTKLQ